MYIIKSGQDTPPTIKAYESEAKARKAFRLWCGFLSDRSKAVGHARVVMCTHYEVDPAGHIIAEGVKMEAYFYD